MSEEAARTVLLDRISEGVVEVMNELYHGRASEARTYWMDDLVVCVLRGAFSAGEETMIDGGFGESVLQQRHATQELQRGQLTAVVEAATGRRVVEFMSGNKINGLVTELFLLDGGPWDQASAREGPS